MLFLIGVLLIFFAKEYGMFDNKNLVSDVESFVSNEKNKIDNGETKSDSKEVTKENIEAPEIIEVEGNIDDSKLNKNYNNIKIDKFFYDQLDENSKIIYNALEENKENMKSGNFEINLGSSFSNLLSQADGKELLGNYYQAAIEAYMYDNVDVYYIDPTRMFLNIESTTKLGKTKYQTFINSGNLGTYFIDEFDSKEQVDEANNNLEAIRKYFTQNDQGSIYANIKLVHDYLVESIEYDTSLSQKNIYNIYGALINKKCVCEGYAKAFKYIMDGLNIPCVLVTGTAVNSTGDTQDHAWNYVQIDKNWYAIDVTWDDPILINGGFLTNSAKYKYFLKGKNEFEQTHFANGVLTEGSREFEYPNLNDNNY